MPPVSPETRALLRLTLTPGLGPISIARLAESLGSHAAILTANEHALRRVKGIGEDRARTIARGLVESEKLADDEIALADQLGVALLGIHQLEYPPLLRQIPDAPPLLYIRGNLDAATLDRFPIAIVGSRSCTLYGTEQAERFALALAQSGLTIVSGGARGIDTAAHRGALRVKGTGGRTLAVLGCGLAHCYPPDNHDLFETIAGSLDGQSHGALISELPLRTPPNAENFPARNRIISGLSLGVLLIEAGRKSGALITAKQAVEDHGREVFALPARVDSSASFGSLDLIKSGGAALVTHPDDLLAALESPARHLHNGTHEARFGAGTAVLRTASESAPEPALFSVPSPRDAALTPAQSAILAALDEPRTLDDLARLISIDPAALRADITILEIRRRLERHGSLLARRA
ncbi:MAG: DNA-protecting protein DprA [Phycisphaerales bacterium]|nr:DNA-protecting protein DprA [Phycisphaerales bacterium]